MYHKHKYFYLYHVSSIIVFNRMSSSKTTLSKNIQIISIDGNIGSGKSTLMNYFIEQKESFKLTEPNTEFVFLLEPVDEWSDIRDESGIPILTKFYENTEKYAFSFQMMVYLSRLSLIKKHIDDFQKNKRKHKKEKLVIITERSLITDKEVFCKMLYDSKKISYMDYSIYNKWYNTFAHDYPISKIIYLATDPLICSERTKQRSREGESKITAEYLWLCDNYHKNMVDTFEIEKGERNVVRLEDSNFGTQICGLNYIKRFISNK